MIQVTKEPAANLTNSANKMPADLSEKGETIRRPLLKNFPTTIYPSKNPETGKNMNKNRRMTVEWYKRYDFVEYSVQNDAIFCKFCRHFGRNASQFTEYGYRNWKKVSTALQKHANSNEHKDSEQQMRDWKLGQKSDVSRGYRGNIAQQLDPTQVNEAFLARNRKHLMTMLDILLFCGRQEILLRGSDESQDSANKGNFLETFDLLQKYSQDVKERFESLPENAKMTHHDIQNGN